MHIARDAMSRIRLAWPNWYINSSGVETGTGSTMSIEASVEYPQGVFTRVPFPTGLTGSIPSGETLWSNWFSVNIPAGATFWTRAFVQNTQGVVSLVMASHHADDGREIGTSLINKVDGGTIAAPSTANEYGPCAIVGLTKRPTHALIGDSRTVGSNDTQDATGDTGILARTIGENDAYINLGCGGDQLARFMDSHTRRKELIDLCSHVHIAYGTNDLGTGSAEAADLAALFEAARTTLHAGTHAPNRRYYAYTVAPRSTSTDAWATTGNQTTLFNNARREAFNDLVRAGLTGFNDFFDVASVEETSEGSGIWNAPGWTTDGVHETQLAALAIKTSTIIDVSAWSGWTP